MWRFALLLTGCQWFYGLDDTNPRGPIVDVDDDGVDDSIDNCPSTANDDQFDTDLDGRGDKCDFCEGCTDCDPVIAHNHDEDGDLLDDGCDPCPSSASNDDTNNDGIGDACDAGAPTRVVMFDGFQTIRAEWLEEGPRWAAIDDRAKPDPDIPSNPYYLQYAMPLGSATWSIEIGISTPTIDFNGFGLVTGNPLGAGDPQCALHLQTGTNYILQTGAAGGINVVEPLPPTVALRLSRRGPSTIDCEIVGTPHRVMRTYTIPNALTIRLHAEHHDNQFTYVLVTE